jgi:hypothetical protein
MNEDVVDNKNPGRPDGRKTARNAAFVNLFVAPGVGSLLAGRMWAGVLQLVLAVSGFTLVIIWFVSLMSQYYGMITEEAAPFRPHTWLGLAGGALFACSWFWALATSINLMREDRKRQPPPIASGR